MKKTGAFLSPMNSRKIRWLLWSGCLGAVILFAGDMLYYGAWGSGHSFSDPSRIISMAPWRFHLGSITAPIGEGLLLLGMLGLWYCCRRAASRLAAVMLAGMYTWALFGVLQHGIFGPLMFAIRSCGPGSDAVIQIAKLNSTLSTAMTAAAYVASAIWILLTLIKKAGVPRWTVLLCPLLITSRLDFAIAYLPAPLGLPLVGGWSNIVKMIWFAVLALTYKDQEIGSQVAEVAGSEPTGSPKSSEKGS